MASTYKLKRKLNEQGVDYTSRRATENFCLIGTPLPPLDKRDAGEFAPLWKQEVRDEKGRRRLHGAFTGGFSAGYYNTVGSAEGWTPSTFVSSRAERAKAKAARPEDYMDEEDLAELRESQVRSAYTQEVPALGTTASERGALDDDPIAASLREALAPAGEDSPGVRLLKKMGWRPGQGIGPRVSWRARKIQDLRAAGHAMSAADVDALDDGADEEARKHTYAPRDTAVVLPPRKDDQHGLGYVKEKGLQEAVGQAQKKAPQGPRLAAGFGLGALNEAEDDDIDVYDAGMGSEKTHMAWDVADRDNEDVLALKNKSRAAGGAPKMVSAGLQTFNDGTPIASGFVLDPNPLDLNNSWPPDPVPEGWKPDPHRVWGRYKDGTAPTLADKSERWRNKLRPEDRGAMLGEEPMSDTRSVFDYMSQKDRERIQNAASTLQSPAQPAPAPPPEPSTGIPFTPPHIAEAALKGFMPYPTDPAKQSRYIAYLRSQAHPEHTDLLPAPAPGQPRDAFARELRDFAQSAAIFKPVSGAMAGRFTSAAALDLGPRIVEGLHQPVHAPEPTPEERRAAEDARRAEEERRAEADGGARAHAVRMGLYGALTREVRPWAPSKLLCKRFGVRDPNPEPEPAAGAKAWRPEDALAEADLATATTAIGAVPLPGAAAGVRAAPDLENIGLGDDEAQGRRILEETRPSMDVFKAIFASDESSSDEEEEDGGKDVVGRAKAVPAEVEVKVSAGEDEDVEMREPGPSVPAHLRASAAKGATPRADSAGPVDLATFKPTFVPREARKARATDEKKGARKKEKARAIVSFAEEDEGGGGGLSIAPVKRKDKDKDKDKERKKKKRRREGGDADAEGEVRKDADADEDMWVEKPPPEVVKGLQVPAAEAGAEAGVTEPDVPPGRLGDVGPPRERKRAVDFLD